MACRICVNVSGFSFSFSAFRAKSFSNDFHPNASPSLLDLNGVPTRCPASFNAPYISP